MRQHRAHSELYSYTIKDIMSVPKRALWRKSSKSTKKKSAILCAHHAGPKTFRTWFKRSMHSIYAFDLAQISIISGQPTKNVIAVSNAWILQQLNQGKKNQRKHVEPEKLDKNGERRPCCCNYAKKEEWYMGLGNHPGRWNLHWQLTSLFICQNNPRESWTCLQHWW